ncbi:hypothetical protein [Clostridium yunnanense]|nr:hypothetical protein [Clostridium yunnanense]
MRKKIEVKSNNTKAFTEGYDEFIKRCKVKSVGNQQLNIMMTL